MESNNFRKTGNDLSIQSVLSRVTLESQPSEAIFRAMAKAWVASLALRHGHLVIWGRTQAWRMDPTWCLLHSKSNHHEGLVYQIT